MIDIYLTVQLPKRLERIREERRKAGSELSSDEKIGLAAPPSLKEPKTSPLSQSAKGSQTPRYKAGGFDFAVSDVEKATRPSSPTLNNSRRRQNTSASSEMSQDLLPRVTESTKQGPNLPDNSSEISSLDDDADFDLLNPATRKFRNDKEYIKYVRLQMWWNFLATGFLGCYAVLLATIASIKDVSFLNLQCKDSIRGEPTVWLADNPAAEVFVVNHSVIVVMSATFFCFVYYSIPYRLNRIRKTEDELKTEAQDRLKALRRKIEPREEVKICGIVIQKARKGKRKKNPKLKEVD